MTLELYQEIALTCDLPEYGLRVGYIATLVDYPNVIFLKR